MGKMSERHIELQDDIMVKISDWKEQIKQSLEPFVEIVKEFINLLILILI
jgi:hypothetical protein